MINLGVSVYPDIRPLDEIKEYLRMASCYGFTRVFSSMFSVEGTKEEVLAYFKELIAFAHEVNMQVSLDVNPELFYRLNATPEDLSVFNDIDLDILRMDMSFGDEGDLKLIDNPYGILIEFNASTGSFVSNLINKGADPKKILTCHNFYPQRYTGLKWERFIQTNADIAKNNVRIGAFVSSNNQPTHGVWDAVCGLPTVEMMRDYPIDLQARLILASNHVTDILIGNAYASKEEMQALKQVVTPLVLDENNEGIKQYLKHGISMEKVQKTLDSKKVIKVVVDENSSEIEKEILFNYFPHIDFGDSSEWIWRSRGPRMIYNKPDKEIKPRNVSKEHFDVGDVVIVNDRYKHYAGEVHIILIPTINDGTCNLVGHIDDQEFKMMSCVKDQDLLIFKEK